MKLPVILSLALAADLFAADDRPKAETFLDPARGGQDYADQGEYKNDWGGAQIIALGEGTFRMVTCRGGLPGSGWDKEFKQETSGKREGDKIVFTGENSYRAELAKGKITITVENGGPIRWRKPNARVRRWAPGRRLAQWCCSTAPAPMPGPAGTSTTATCSRPVARAKRASRISRRTSNS